LNWVRQQRLEVPLLTSVCPGSLVFAAAGLLAHRPATTHWSSLETLAQLDPTVEVRTDERFVDDGDVVTSAGISAESTWRCIWCPASPVSTEPEKYAEGSSTTQHRRSELHPSHFDLYRLSRGLRSAVHYLTRVVHLRLHHCYPSRATERLGSLTSQQPPHRGPVLMPRPMRTVMKPVHTQQLRRTRERLIRRRHIDLGRYRSALCRLP
jgi:hypothetical protein